MTERLNNAVEQINAALWGIPVLFLLIAGGIYLTAKTGFPQLRIISIFKTTAATIFRSKAGGKGGSGLSGLQGFSTALAAAVGTGSVAGVGAAIAAGGKGAVFWMWISALIGMAVSYCENYLGVKYSRMTGICGAMSYLRRLKKGKYIACAYAVFTVLASLGMGNMAQASSIVTAAEHGFGLSKYITAFVLLLFTALTIGGRDFSAKLCERLVPFMALIFIGGSLFVIVTHPFKAAEAVKDIVMCAFSPKAFAGGTLGTVCIEGIKRGAFSNEAGLGSSAAVHSSCADESADCCRRLGIMGMAEVFIDTIVICTLTALVIIISGTDLGSADSAAEGYSAALGIFGKYFICFSLILFALATIAGWFFIGEKAFLYIFGKSQTYRMVFLICIYFGCIYSPSLVWGISDIFNGLMAIPNMAGVLLLSGEIPKPLPFKSKAK